MTIHSSVTAQCTLGLYDLTVNNNTAKVSLAKDNNLHTKYELSISFHCQLISTDCTHTETVTGRTWTSVHHSPHFYTLCSILSQVYVSVWLSFQMLQHISCLSIVSLVTLTFWSHKWSIDYMSWHPFYQLWTFYSRSWARGMHRTDGCTNSMQCLMHC